MAAADETNAIIDAVAAAVAARWFGATDPARTWLNMTPYERRRFQSVAEAAIVAYVAAVADPEV